MASEARCATPVMPFGQSIVQHWRREQIFFRDGGRLRRRRDQPLCALKEASKDAGANESRHIFVGFASVVNNHRVSERLDPVPGTSLITPKDVDGVRPLMNNSVRHSSIRAVDVMAYDPYSVPLYSRVKAPLLPAEAAEWALRRS